MSNVLPFPAVILEANGILYIGDGQRAVIADTPAKVAHLLSDMAVPSGLIAFNYEKRADLLLHHRILKGGKLESQDGRTWDYCERLLSKLDTLIAKSNDFNHPLFGVASLEEGKRILTDLAGSHFDNQIIELNRAYSSLEMTTFDLQANEARRVLAGESKKSTLLENMCLPGESIEQLAKKIVSKNDKFQTRLAEMLREKRERVKTVSEATSIEQLRKLNWVEKA